jgi:hypothetical protein
MQLAIIVLVPRNVGQLNLKPILNFTIVDLTTLTIEALENSPSSANDFKMEHPLSKP